MAEDVWVTCEECGIEFPIPRWQFDEDLRFEPAVWQCPDCIDLPDEAYMEIEEDER